MAASSNLRGWFFAAHGGLFTFIGFLALTAQALWGEWLFEGNGQKKPLGAEFACTFFAFGQVFLFIGLAELTRSRRQRVVLNYLAAANGLQVAMLAAWLVAQAAIEMAWSPSWHLLTIWLTLVLTGWVLTVRHPDYRYAAQLPALSDAPVRTAPHTPGSRSERQVRAVRKLAWQFDRKDWLRASFAGAAVGLIPVLLFGGAFVSRENFKDGGSVAPFAIFLLLAFLMFGGIALGMALLCTVFARAWRLMAPDILQEYDTFARQIGGRVVTGGPQVPLDMSAFSRGVIFPHAGGEARLEVVTKGTGEFAKVYTQTVFAYLRPTDFTCRISSQVGLAVAGELFGLQDVRLGWPLFDDCFVVRASNEYRASQIVDREVQEELLQLRHWTEQYSVFRSAGTPEIEFRIERDSLTIRIEGLLDQAEKLIDFYHRADRIDRAVRQHVLPDNL